MSPGRLPLPRPAAWPIVRSVHGAIRLIVPVCIYLLRSLTNVTWLRFGIRWLTSNIDPDRSALRDAAPWITFQAREWLHEYLARNKNPIAFEYGSGGSTVFLAERAQRLISVEHDPAWYRAVSHSLAAQRIVNCEYILVAPGSAPAVNSDVADPESFRSAVYPDMSFQAYVKTINAFPEGCFGVILIDGRARPSCIRYARKKVKPGGILILDNSEREHYVLGKALLANWERRDFFGPGPYGRFFWQTSIWTRPVD